jgi:acetyltransferase-like isoleucine patch superfamily enzyme
MTSKLRKVSIVAYVSICAIVKNESCYIAEWLSYHYAIGVRKFVIFHNSSTDNTLEVIHNWPKSSEAVQVIEWPYDAPQVSAYREMLKNYRHVSEWCAFIDVDEFLVPNEPRSLLDTLYALPWDCGGLFVHWLFFGSSGHVERQPGLVTETFTRRAPENFGPNRNGKTIVRLNAATDLISPHVIGSRLRIINTRGDDIEQYNGGLQETACHEHLSLNHYFTKSLEEWRVRRALGRPALPKSHPDSIRSEGQFQTHDVNDLIDDRAALMTRNAREMFAGYSLDAASASAAAVASVPVPVPVPAPEPTLSAEDAAYDDAAVAAQPWLPKSPAILARQVQLQALLARRAGAKFAAGTYVAPDAGIFTHELSLGEGSWIASGAIVRGNVQIGANSSVNAYCQIAGNVKIGNGCRIGALTSIYGFAHGTTRTDIPIMSQPMTSLGVVLQDDVLVGGNVVILDGVEIGAHSVILAGAIVSENCPAYSVVGGNPAQIIENRNDRLSRDNGAP